MPSEKQKLNKSRLYVDENVLGRLGTNQEKDQLLVFIEILQEYWGEHGGVVLGAEYWSFPIGQTSQLHDVLYTGAGAAMGLDRDQLKELAICMERCGVSSLAPLAVTAVAAGRSAAYLSSAYAQAVWDAGAESIHPSLLCELPTGLSGTGTLSANAVSNPCFFVRQAGGVLELCRGMLRIFIPTRSEFHLIASYAFPQLVLHPDLDLNDFKLKLNMYFGTVLDHLTYLNDSFIPVANEVGWDLYKMVSRAAQYAEFSDEGDKTKRDKAKMKLRTRSFTVQGLVVELCCTLHTKITGHLGGRIHFHGPVPNVAPNKVFIAVFTDHLAT